MTPLLAYRAGPVATEAVYAFEDYAGEASAITVEPSEQFKLRGRLRSMGVPRRGERQLTTVRHLPVDCARTNGAIERWSP